VSDVIIYSVITIAVLGTVSAMILFFVARQFKVIENPKIDDVEEVLPGANCGGCGYAGCRNFAEAIVKTNSLEGMNCPPGGTEVMDKVASIMGMTAEVQAPLVAVMRCSGSKANAPAKVQYDGPETCFFAHNLSAAESGCPYGCFGLADCVRACKFDAMYMDEETGLPVIIEENCVACGACVEACPRDIIELRKVGPKSKRIFVSCINEEKGGVAKKHCSVACIGCGKCEKECKFDAITIENNLAYIDFNKCTLCRKCVIVCPTNAIHELNFKPRKPKPEKKTLENVVKTDAKVVVESEKTEGKPLAKIEGEATDNDNNKE